MDLNEAKGIMDLIHASGVQSIERRNVDGSNRRAQAALVIANMETARQLSQDDSLDGTLEALTTLMGNPT